MRILGLFAAALLAAGPVLGESPLVELQRCVRVEADWADGDSFPVRTGDGTELTVRLYGVDCFEWHVNDEADARRLSDQRRYFGIANRGENAKASIDMAKEFGAQAARRIAQLLAKPFTVHTAHASARGDGRHERVYAFITLADGRDLASVLVEEGLARAFGVCRTTPGGLSQADYRETLRDLELRAAKFGTGVWAKTDWAALPAERQTQRQEESTLDLATDSRKSPPTGLLDPNTAPRDTLQQLPGVGESLANRIIEGRPYASLDDLLEVPGIGTKKLTQLKPFLKFTPSKKDASGSSRK